MIGIGILGLAIALLCGQLADMYMQLIETEKILKEIRKKKKKRGKIRVPITCKDRADWDGILEYTELKGKSVKRKTASTT